MFSRPLIAAALIAALGFSSAQAQSPSVEAQADALLREVIARDGGPGVMAAVMRDGRVLWSGAVGMADLETQTPLTGHTRMRIGSVSKPFTAAMALRLAEQGKLDLDADARVLAPELVRPETGTITARNLGAHTSGVRQYDFANYLDANNVYYYPTLTAALARVAGDPLVSQPGVAWRYSSIGYNVLGVLAERAGGGSYADLLASQITGPLALSDTLIDHPLEIVPGRTRFYTRFPDGQVRNTIWRDSSDYYPSGGLLSTAGDLARFTSAVFGGRWLPDDAMALVLTEAKTSDGASVGYTFGWQVRRNADGSVAWYGHGGETNGANAVVRYYPEDRLVIAAIVNANAMGGRPYFFEAVTERLPALFRNRQP